MNLSRLSLCGAFLAALLAPSLHAQTSPAFNATLRSDAAGNLFLAWPSQTTQRYHIESSSDLRTWSDQPGALPGTGGELSASVLPSGAPPSSRQFWRVVATSSTTTFYVSPSGNDAQPGSASQPWRTLQKAANTLEPGQTAIVRPGVYNEVLTVNRGGICGAARVSLLSETLHGAKFRRAVIKADYVTLDGFEIEEDTVDAGVSIQGSAYTVVSNCYIHDCPEYGISLRHLPNSNPLKLPRHFVLSGNRIEHNGQVGIRIKGSSGLVEGNTITRTVAYHPKAAGLVINGTDADGMHVFGNHHTIRNNTISNIGDPAENDITGTGAPHVDFFQSWDGSAHANPSEVIMSDCLIENNYCWSTHPSSKALIAESVGGTMGAHDLTIRNNIFEFRDAGIFLQQYTAGFPHRNISIYNNIFTAMLGDTSWGCGICMNGVVDYQVFNNIMVNCHPEIRQITGSGFIDYNFAWYSDGATPRFTTPAPQAHEAVGNPGFVGFTGVHGANDYHLGSSSPLLDKGKPDSPSFDDLSGQPRPQGAGFEPGPYEYAVHTPFAPAVTLPKWPQNKKAALVLRFDDGTPGQAQLGIPALSRRKLTGTWYINPGRDIYPPNRSLWETAPSLNQELANHTMNHREVSGEELMQKEVEDAAREIWRIRGHAFNGSLMSFCLSTESVWPWTSTLKDQILGSLSNVDHQAYPGLTYAGYVNYSVPTGANSDMMYAIVPRIIESGNWGRVSFHGITAVAGASDWGVGAVHIDELNQFLDKVLAVTGDVWVAGQIQLYKYMQEQQRSTVTITDAYSDRVAFNLNASLSALYDEPLALVVGLPAFWARCQVEQGSSVAVYDVGADHTALVYAVPNQGEIVVTQAQAAAQ